MATTTEQPAAVPQQATPQAPSPATTNQSYKFEGFQAFGFQPKAVEYLTKQLETIEPEKRKSLISSERSISDWTAKVVDDTFSRHMTLLEKEEKMMAKTIAEQQEYVKSIEPKAKEIFGEEADTYLKMLSEKAKTPTDDFKLFQTLSQQVLNLRSGVSMEKRPNSGEKFIKAASAGDGEQSSKRFGMPTPDSSDNSAESKHHNLLMSFLGRK